MRHHPFRIIPYAVLAASVGLSGVAALAPSSGQPIAAVFPPWWTAERAFGAAASSGAPIIRFAGLPSILVLASGKPDLPRRLREAGALLLLNAQAIGACAAKV